MDLLWDLPLSHSQEDDQLRDGEFIVWLRLGFGVGLQRVVLWGPPSSDKVAYHITSYDAMMRNILKHFCSVLILSLRASIVLYQEQYLSLCSPLQAAEE